jgi:hypothetical protein
MAQIDDILSELRHRIMGPFEGEPPKPATQEVDSPVEHSAIVALHRLSHPERNGGVVVEANPVSELMRQAVVFIEHWNAELNERDGGVPPRLTESVAPAVLEQATPTLQDDATGQVVISLCFDAQLLARIDAVAKRMGITRIAWLHSAASERLEGRR